MGKIKTIFERIKTKISSEELAKIESDITEGISEDEKLYTQLADLRRESAERRERVQELDAETTKLRTKVTELQTANEKLSTATDTPEYKAAIEKAAKYDDMVKKQDTELTTKWSEIAKKLTVDKSDKLYDKVQKVIGKFIFPKENEELPIDAIRMNLSTYDLLESTSYFTPETTPAGGNSPAGNGNHMPGNSGQAYIAEIKTK